MGAGRNEQYECCVKQNGGIEVEKKNNAFQMRQRMTLVGLEQKEISAKMCVHWRASTLSLER